MAENQCDTGKGKLIVNIINELMNGHNNGKALRSEVIKRATEAGMNEDMAEDILKRLKWEGDIFEPRKGFIKNTHKLDVPKYIL